MSNQDFEGKAPAGGAGASAAPAGAPDSLEQQLAKEREARALMRDRLRHTEALAAESHALRSRMAQELERVTADRDRLRTAAANAPAMGSASATAPAPAPSTSPPLMTPREAEWPLKPPEPPRRSGPWRALAMLGGLAAGVAALAWITGTLPAGVGGELAGASAPAGNSPHVAAASAPVVVAAAKPAPTAAPASANGFPLPSGAVALPPLTPEQQLAAAPTAAGPVPVVAAAAAPTALATRLRTALDGEGISSPVEIDAANGHVMVADPQSDYALRDRTDLVIRSVYAGASLPEPQIEHRWLSPKRGDHVAQAAPPAAEPSPAPSPPAAVSPAAAYAARHAAAEHHKKTSEKTVAEAEELRPVVPAGRVTASCMAGLSPKSASRRADLTACMKRSCCASPGTDECRAYQKAYTFTCSAG